MDIVGPLPQTSTGHRYILVICDYATRYPEAMPLKDIMAETIAEQLVLLFSRVGIPAEILTDQGTNFMSALLKELYQRLNIASIRTSPYHPQMDDLVECFNQTLKAMLRKFTTADNHDWDKDLPYLLFAYREVPQASTGFAPFELLYGHNVWGPLDVFRDNWTAKAPEQQTVVSHLLDIRTRLADYHDLVETNLRMAQQDQKRWYDKTARQRKLNVGDNVLVLLPNSTNKLLAQWEGPYPITKSLDPVNYEVNMFEKRKKRRVFHVNMLSQWHASTATACYIDEVTHTNEEDDLYIFDEGASEDPIISDHLTPVQRTAMEALLSEYGEVLSNQPGRTSVVEHVIDTADSKLVGQQAYRLPHAYRNKVRDELDRMLSHDIIEPSSSDYAAPIVLSFKKDGSLRLCVDYRRLNSVSTDDA